jgi:hypothetical protein
MGEEKPDEELMGKRKSSPRLSTASRDADNDRMSVWRENIHQDENYNDVELKIFYPDECKHANRP